MLNFDGSPSLRVNKEPDRSAYANLDHPSGPRLGGSKDQYSMDFLEPDGKTQRQAYAMSSMNNNFLLARDIPMNSVLLESDFSVEPIAKLFFSYSRDQKSSDTPKIEKE